jgi:hypothetical protein
MKIRIDKKLMTHQSRTFYPADDFKEASLAIAPFLSSIAGMPDEKITEAWETNHAGRVAVKLYVEAWQNGRHTVPCFRFQE